MHLATTAAAASLLGTRSLQPTVLILGGTRFLGRAMAEEALRRNYLVSLFHRGKTGADLFPLAEHIKGDRNGQLEGLRGRHWDIVLDTSGQKPSQVRQSAELLKNCDVYVYISSISVYDTEGRAGMDENSPLLSTEGVDVETEAPETYGARKVACEREVRRILPEKHVICRPCLIVGPHDPTDRFTYWVMRSAEKRGKMLAPGKPSDPAQWIDARDLAIFCLDVQQRGTFNTVGPERPAGIGDLIAACEPKDELVWVPAEFLEKEGVQPWVDMPAWVPDSGFTQIANDKALKAGLRFRPLRETAVDTYAWRKAQPQPLSAGLSAEREQEVLRRYLAQKGELPR